MSKRLAVRILATLAALLALGAAPWRSLPPCVIGKWSGITPIDEQGNPTGPADSTDWGCVGGIGTAAGTAPSVVGPPPPPTAFCLRPAAPNPMVAATRLTLTVPRAGHVRVAVYAKKGNGPHNAQLARTLVDATLAAGVHQILWDGTDDAGVRLAADLYRVVMESEDGSVCGDVEVR